ncbi:transposase [Rathayibacter tanaceti]|uniref:Transposase n=1 Tax=Rathayibacter tanaceti TaxID=1671680 RepID=A0AAE6RL74_9MICO|nr:transposase [Rathayibacter tanaceti]
MHRRTGRRFADAPDPAGSVTRRPPGSWPAANDARHVARRQGLLAPSDPLAPATPRDHDRDPAALGSDRPPHTLRLEGGRPPAFDADDYRGRNVVERGFTLFTQWRGLATRYDNLALAYRAAAILHAITLWTRTLSDTPSAPRPGRGSRSSAGRLVAQCHRRRVDHRSDAHGLVGESRCLAGRERDGDGRRLARRELHTGARDGSAEVASRLVHQCALAESVRPPRLRLCCRRAGGTVDVDVREEVAAREPTGAVVRRHVRGECPGHGRRDGVRQRDRGGEGRS